MFIFIEITLLLVIISGIRSAESNSYNEKCDSELCNSTLMKKLNCNSVNKCHGYLLPKGPCDCCPVCVGYEEKSAAKIFPTSTERTAVTDKTTPKIRGLPRAGEVNEKENEEYDLEYDYGADEDDDDEEESEETKREIAKFLQVLLSEPKSAESPTDQMKKNVKY